MTTPRLNWPAGLFDPDSETCHVALENLSVALDQLGFKVRKKSAQEATLRVYPERHNEYPLLNPRFVADAIYRGTREAGGFLVVNVLSKGNAALDERLRNFNSKEDIEFIATDHDSGGYHYHGEFVVPLKGAATSAESIVFDGIREPLREIGRICKGL